MRVIFWILYVSLFYLTGTSQTYNFRNYGEQNGLSQNYIYSISQSPEGYLSLATGENINFFDGRKFKSFSPPELKGKFTTTQFVDSRKNTWFGHREHGVSVFTKGVLMPVTDPVLSMAQVTQIREDNFKNIFVSTAANGLFLIDSLYHVNRISGKGLPDEILDFCFDADNTIFLTGPRGLFTLELNRLNLKTNVSRVKELSGFAIRSIIPASASRKEFWIAGEDGIIKIVKKGNRYKPVLKIKERLESVQNNIASIFSDKSGNLWVALFEEGLRKISFRSGKDFVVNKIERKNGLSSSDIRSIYQDNEGNMWFGTYGAGLIEKPNERFTFYGRKEGFNRGFFNAIAFDNKHLWLGSKSGLLSVNHEYGSISKVKDLHNQQVNALLLDSEKNLWIGGDQFIYLRKNNGTIQNFSIANKINERQINHLIEADEKIIFGTSDGIILFNKESNEIEYVRTDQGLLHNNVKHLFRDSKNRLWISSHGSVPYYIKDRKVNALKNIEGLNSFKINSVCEDLDGNIWIATEGNGVFKYDDENFVNYTTTKGLLSNYCYGIICDKNNTVWVTHKSGLSEKKSLLKNFNALGKDKGLLITENNLNAVYKDSLDNIWFGAKEGLIRYNCDNESFFTAEPRLIFSGLSFNNEAAELKKKIRKSYGYYHVKIDFQTISFTDPEGIKFRYRLLGVDTNWRTTVNSFVEFPRLNDGEYIFELIACYSNGVCSTKPAQLLFYIAPPVWKQSWFYVLLAIVVISAVYLFVYLRIRNLKRIQTLLQETVRQKTFLLQKEKEEVEKVKTELEKKNKDITDSIQYAKRIQESLLPPESLMNRLFHEKYFVFYQPKDIVSGDFYWTSEIKTDEIDLSFAAVFDCTGHGVPGAFLSIVANDFLKQAVLDKDIKYPNQILDYLNENIIQNLNQSATMKNRMMDGLDIAIVAIDYKAWKLFYSGANNPVYVFRKAGASLELHLLKSTKQAIGHVDDTIRKYDLREFELQPGDTVYLFSDGYADQFGGTNDKKYNYTRFKQTLFEAFELPIAEQKTFLEEAVNGWKGNTEQTDDICVMGIRF